MAGIVVDTTKCPLCKRIANRLGNKTPKGWLPFAWGPIEEIPRHFYIFPESTPVPTPSIPQQLDVTEICKLTELERR